MKSIVFNCLALLVLLATQAQSAIADDIQLFEPTDYQDPVPVVVASPEYPRSLRARGTEGWVLLQLGITAEGEPGEVRIVDASLPGVFDELAVESVADVRYEPARQDGQPVPADAMMRMNFVIQGQKNAVAPSFLRRTQKVLDALEAEDFAQAEALIEELGEGREHYLAEQSYLAFIKSWYAERTGDETAALEHLNEALVSARNGVDPTSYEDMLRRAVGLNTRAGLLGAALDRYDELLDFKGELAAGDRTAELVSKIQQVLAGPEQLSNERELETCHYCTGSEGFRDYHTLARQRFKLETESGALSAAKLRCGFRLFDVPLETGASFNYPQQADRCVLELSAAEPTAVTIVELPAES